MPLDLASSRLRSAGLASATCLLSLYAGGDGFSTLANTNAVTSMGNEEHRRTQKGSAQKGPRGYLCCGILLTSAALGAFRRRTPASGSRAQVIPESQKGWAVAVSRFQVVGSGCILAAQYALLLIFGVYGSELLDPRDANKLYAAANWGACFLSAPAGLCFDALGPAWSSLLGGLASSFGLALAALALSAAQGATSLFVASLGYLVFGFGTTLLNTVGILAAVRVAPAQHSGKVAAAVLCSAALGMSFHTAVHAKWCWGAPFRFINYQILYSLFCAVLGLVMFRSRAWTVCLAEVEPQEKQSISEEPTKSPSSSPSGRRRLLGIIKAKDFPWLAAIYLVPIAFCFAWLGNWTVYANSLGLSEQAKTRIGLSVGFFSAAGRLIFGILGDWTPKGRGLVGLELGFTTSLGLFVGSFILLGLDPWTFFEPAMRLQSFGFGGVLCLAAVALRASFSGEDLGTAFGFLYQILTVTFMFFNWGASPSSSCGPECFKGFFAVSGLLHAGCMCWGARRLLRAYSTTPAV
ncbi:Uncharacterized protein SCF082_LOCUS49730 [Durusdinium trenchii]|uniref:Uncharacterized protein n=1 Tax=Durusdinium trenchii TaxID=1381693 RepID=A0ABP0S368_9DINO